MKNIMPTGSQTKKLSGLLTEAASLDKIINAVNKDNSMDDDEILELKYLISSDPTYVYNSHGSFVGKYWKWIYKQYKQGNIRLGDQPELEAALNTYNINKSQINRPIDSFNTLDELVEVIADYDDNFKASRTLPKGEQGLEKVYEDQYVTVYIPHTWEAARKIGGDTRWCTASSSNYYFNLYLNNYGGEYYDIIRKSDGAKFQLHVESNQFMDSDDKPITFASVFGTLKEAAGLLNFLKSREKDISKWEPKTWFDEVQAKLDSGEDPEDVFDYCYNFCEGFGRVALNDKGNFINTEGNLLSDKWFDDCWRFKEGFGRVELNGKYNYINIEGKLLSDKWFDGCWEFDEGFARVELKGKRNYINIEGKLLSDKWFDGCWEFDEGFARVELNGKYNYINKEGKFLSDTWFDKCWSFYEGFAAIKLNGKYNYINREGKFLSDMWFDGCWEFDEGFAVVKLNNKYNFINTDGKLLSDKWFDMCDNFIDGFGTVKSNGKWYYIGKNGKLYNKIPTNENMKHKKIVLTEKQADRIIDDIISEAFRPRYAINSNAVLQVVRYLDSHFTRDTITDITSDNKITDMLVGNRIDSHGQVVDQPELKKIVKMLEDVPELKSLISDKKVRAKFFAIVVYAWHRRWIDMQTGIIYGLNDFEV